MRDIASLVLVTGSLTALSAAGCASGTDSAREREQFAREGTREVVIGAPWPWSSRPELLYGQGLRLAVEQANAEGGVNGRKLRLRQVDDGGAADRARLVAQELANDPRVVAVIGHHQSYVTVAAAPIYDHAGLVLLSATSTSTAVTAPGYRHVFQATFTDVDVGRSMADFALDRGCRRLAVYYSRDDHGRDLANAFEEFAARNGVQVVARESVDPAEPANPLRAEQVANNWRRRLIDAVFLATPHRQAAVMAVELRRQGFHGPLVGSDALAAPGFVTAGGAAVEGTVFATAFSRDMSSPQAQRFTQAFQRRYGKKPDVTAALGYDAIGVLVHAMREAGSVLPSAVTAALHSVRNWSGVTGVFSFNDAGRLTDPTVNTAVIRDGRPHALVDPTTAPGCAEASPSAEGW